MLSLLLVSIAVSTSSWAKPAISERAGGLIPGLIGRRADSGCSGSESKTSCENDSTKGTCCFESPGGLLMQTQFWDTDPVTGPDDSWTIHGLWPDHCDGTYDSSCDPDREYDDITSLMSDQGADKTLEYMQDYWQDINGDDESFWAHEWGKHGTCMSTFEADCLGKSAKEGADAVAYFETVVSLFKNLTTYDFLEKHDITPDESATYDLKDISDALSSEAGDVKISVDCDGNNLNSVGYYFNLKGSAIDGEFIPVDAIEEGSCPDTGVKYVPKSGNRNSTASQAAARRRSLRSTTRLPL